MILDVSVSVVPTPTLLRRSIMAGTIQPIAALTAEDHGPINTIVSIVLPVTSILIATVRMAMRRQKFHQLESDDIVFGAGLVRIHVSTSCTHFANQAQCFGVFTSILSHFCVRAGLGRHQDTLDDKQMAHYFKVNSCIRGCGLY